MIIFNNIRISHPLYSSTVTSNSLKGSARGKSRIFQSTNLSSLTTNVLTAINNSTKEEIYLYMCEFIQEKSLTSVNTALSDLRLLETEMIMNEDTQIKNHTDVRFAV